MLRDFDFVTMEDYVNDTSELAQQGAAVISSLHEQIAHRERMIWAIVKAAGGKVSIPHSVLVRAPQGGHGIEMWRDESEDALCIRAQ